MKQQQQPTATDTGRVHGPGTDEAASEFRYGMQPGGRFTSEPIEGFAWRKVIDYQPDPFYTEQTNYWLAARDESALDERRRIAREAADLDLITLGREQAQEVVDALRLVDAEVMESAPARMLADAIERQLLSRPAHLDGTPVASDGTFSVAERRQRRQAVLDQLRECAREIEAEPHDCLTDDKLHFVAHYGAPGIGQSWECDVCGRSWAKVGGSFHDPSEGAHVLRPEDVI